MTVQLLFNMWDEITTRCRLGKMSQQHHFLWHWVLVQIWTPLDCQLHSTQNWTPLDWTELHCYTQHKTGLHWTLLDCQLLSTQNCTGLYWTASYCQHKTGLHWTLLDFQLLSTQNWTPLDSTGLPATFNTLGSLIIQSPPPLALLQLQDLQLHLICIPHQHLYYHPPWVKPLHGILNISPNTKLDSTKLYAIFLLLNTLLIICHQLLL